MAAGPFIPKYYAGISQAWAPPQAASACHAVRSRAGTAWTGRTFHGSPGPFSTCVPGGSNRTQLCLHRSHAHYNQLPVPRRSFLLPGPQCFRQYHEADGPPSLGELLAPSSFGFLRVSSLRMRFGKDLVSPSDPLALSPAGSGLPACPPPTQAHPTHRLSLFGIQEGAGPLQASQGESG